MLTKLSCSTSSAAATTGSSSQGNWLARSRPGAAPGQPGRQAAGQHLVVVDGAPAAAVKANGRVDVLGDGLGRDAADEVQLCTLLSVKTGGCPEDCAYCPQSSRYDTGVGTGRMLKADEVLAAAREAREAGSTRFCMGAAWREVTDGRAFDRVLEMLKGAKK